MKQQLINEIRVIGEALMNIATILSDEPDAPVAAATPPVGAARETPSPAPVASAPAPQAPSGPTKDEVRAALRELAERKGPDVAKQIIAKLGVANLSQVPEAKYGEVIAEARAA